MMIETHPSWQFPITSNIPKETHILSFILLFATFIILLSAFLYIRQKMKSSPVAGTIIVRAFYILSIGMLLMNFNETIVQLSIILTYDESSRWALFILGNALPLSAGFLIFLYGIMSFVRNISVLRGFFLHLQNAAYILLLTDTVLAMAFMTGSLTGILPQTEAGILMTYTVLIGNPIAMFFLVVMFLGIFKIPNKLTRLRISLVSVSIYSAVITVVLLSWVPAVYYLIPGGRDIYPVYHNIFIPISMFITYTTAIIFLYLALFPTMWLQRHTGVLPPSFVEMMAKRKKLASEEAPKESGGDKQ